MVPKNIPSFIGLNEVSKVAFRDKYGMWMCEYIPERKICLLFTYYVHALYICMCAYIKHVCIYTNIKAINIYRPFRDLTNDWTFMISQSWKGGEWGGEGSLTTESKFASAEIKAI